MSREDSPHSQAVPEKSVHRELTQRVLRTLSHWREKVHHKRLQNAYTTVFDADGLLSLRDISSLDQETRTYVLRTHATHEELEDTEDGIRTSETVGMSIIFEHPGTKFETKDGEYISPTRSLIDVIFNAIAAEEYSRYRTAEIATTLKPEPVRGTFGYKEDLTHRHPQQYAREPTTGLTQNAEPVRRILIRGNNTNELIKALYQLSTICRKNSEPLSTYFDSNLEIHETRATILIELLNNLGILYDERFYPLAVFLRDYTFTIYDSVEQARSIRRFSTFQEDVLFWKEGELKKEEYEARFLHKAKYETVLNANPEVYHTPFPDINSWDSNVHTADMIAKKIKKLSPTSIITSVMVKHPGLNPESHVVTSRMEDTRQARATRALLIKDHETLQRNTHSKQSIEYLLFFEHITKSQDHLAQDRELFIDHVQQLCKAYKDNPYLHAKSRTLLSQFAAHGEEVTAAYTINITQLMHNPLFSWMGRFYNPFPFDVSVQPTEQILSAKFLVYEILRLHASIHEDTFLFQASNSFTQDDVDSARTFFDGLKQCTANPPAEHTLLASTYTELGELLTPQQEKKRKRSIRDWHSRPFVRGVRIPYHIDISRRFLKNATSTGLALMGLLTGIYTYSSLNPPSVSSRFSGSANERRIPLFGGTEWMGPQDLFADPPDRLSRREIEKTPPKRFLSSVMLPNTIPETNGERIGFFPESDLSYISYDNSADVPIIPTKSPTIISIEPNQMAFQFASPNNWIYPPEGYKIVKAYQTGGDEPYYTKSYSLLYSGSSTFGTPYDWLLVVVEPLQRATVLDRHGKEITGVDVYNDPDFRSATKTIEPVSDGYDFFSYSPGFMQEQYKLLTESSYKKLYADFMRDYAKSVATQDVDTISQTIIEYAHLYRELIQSTRHYSLEFTATENDMDSTFIRVANNPDAGFYCSIAAKAFDHFLLGTGIDAELLPGSDVTFYDSEGWVHLGHMKNLVHLPNGNQLVVDTTPPVTKDTPPEDIQALRHRGPDDAPVDYAKIISELLKMALPLSLTAAGIASLAAALSILYDRRTQRCQLERFSMLKKLADTNLQLSSHESSLCNIILHAIATTPFQKDREHHILQVISILHLLKRTLLSEGAACIEWVSSHTGIVAHTLATSSSYTHTEGDSSTHKHIIEVLREEYAVNPTGVLALFTPVDADYMRKYVLEPSIQHFYLPTHIQDYLEVGILVAKMHIHDTTEYFAAYHKQRMQLLSDKEKQLLIQVEETERSRTLASCVEKVVASGATSQQNMKYLAYILSCVS